MIGPSWVIFTVMGAHEFAVHWHNMSAARGAMLGMSILLGGRGLGALVGPLVSARWAGRSDRRLQLGILFGYLIIAVDTERWGSAARFGWPRLRHAGACGRINGLGFLDDAVAASYR